MSKILLHWRKDSGELEVFEAANYFAAANDHQVSCLNNALTFSHKLIREGCNNQAQRSGRISLDMPVVAIRHPSTPTPQNYKPQLKQGTSSSLLPSQIMENPSALKQKCKQPRSPGRMLASCLNILFYQTVSSKKRKKKKKLMISAMKDNEDAHSLASGRISELNGRTSSYITARNTTSSTSGFRTTLSSSYPYNPRNSCKDNHRRPQNKIEFSSEISKISVHHWADNPSEENEHTKFDDDDDDEGGDSDTSSDLFDLPNNELLDCSSGGLPVYGTTQMNTIKIKSGGPISATVI